MTHHTPDSFPPLHHLKKLIELSPDLFCISNFQGEIRWMSQRWEDLLGWSLEELQERHYATLLHPRDVEAAQKAFLTLQSGKNIAQHEHRILHKDGSWRWLQWNASPDHETGEFFCSARDITQEKRAASERESLISQMKMAEEVAHVGHWLLELGNNELIWSDELYRIHGRTPQNSPLTSAEIMETYPTKLQDLLNHTVLEAIASRTGFSLEYDIPRPNGSVRRVLTRGICRINADNEVNALFGITQDITETHAIQRKLLHSERLASTNTLASRIIHEINNPLTFLQSNLDFLQEESPCLASIPPTELQAALADAKEGCIRIQTVVKNLQTFSEPPSHNRTWIHVDEAMRSAMGMIRNSLEERARLVHDLDQAPPVFGEETLLIQAFLDVLENACNSIPEGKPHLHRISVSTRPGSSGNTIVEIQSTGRDLPHSWRSNTALSACEGIVTNMNGKLHVESDPLLGSLVRISLPARETPTPSPPTTPDEMQHIVLVGDPDEHVGIALHQILPDDHCVYQIKESKKLLQILEATREFDAIICNTDLPEEEHQKLLRILEKDPHPILFRLLYIQDEGAPTPKDKKARAPIFQKPFLAQALRQAITERTTTRALPPTARKRTYEALRRLGI